MLTVALAKGRILDKTVEMLEDAGFSPEEDVLDTRRYIVFDRTGEIRYLLAKPVDVPTYVEHGAADIGFVGKDVLYEAQADVHELLDLGIGVCRLVVAGPADVQVANVRRVATKYHRYAHDFFRKHGRQIEVIDLHGSVELAPLTGLADCIVDIVETGQTLRENGLVVHAELGRVSTRVVANRRSYQLRAAEVDGFIDRLRNRVEEGVS